MTFSVQPVIGPIVGALFGFFLNRVAESRKILYCADGQTVFERRDEVAGLTVLQDGIPVERLARSHVWIWNSARKSIKPEDVIASDPITIRFDDKGEILSLQVINAAPGATTFRFRSPENGSCVLQFDHWAGKAGVMLEILHTSRKVVPVLTGTVEAFQPAHCLGRISTGSFQQSRVIRQLRRFAPIGGIASMALGALAIVKLNATIDPKGLLVLALMGFGEMLLLTSGVAYLDALRIPRTLRKFGIDRKV
ncbi:hypothetical protein [Paraburkholderia tropica]|uniref:Uncharacterized protein n=1 Tax=Paraburkholderia tropica TaxID=92647 RepID=A0AAQ1GPM5_9BURK|nr:hypothetical protein [Paraburkholderia tropica]RQN33843.1 hypothetical protein EHZ25_37575 [Paraburkholderia tropica]SEK15594.1 hypothetical protein SAMN05216550_1432 [Paraburkholderia tropica]